MLRTQGFIFQVIILFQVSLHSSMYGSDLKNKFVIDFFKKRRPIFTCTPPQVFVVASTRSFMPYQPGNLDDIKKCIDSYV
jgi:hypothetical protein